MLPRRVPQGLEASASARVLRSFLVVRMVRGSGLLLFLAIALVGVDVRGWPTGVTVALALAVLTQAGALVVWWRRYTRAREAANAAQ